MRRAVRSRAFQLTPAGYRTHRRVSIFGRIYGGTARKHEEEAARKAAGRCTRSRSRDSSLFWNLADDNTRVPFPSFEEDEGRVGLSARTIPRSVGGSRFIATSASVLRDLRVIQFRDSPRVYVSIIVHRRSTERKYRSVRCLVN